MEQDKDSDLRYQMPIIKRGLLPEELEAGVKAKLKSLLGGRDVPVEYAASVEAIRKFFAVRSCVGNPDRLDQRCAATTVLADECKVPDRFTSPAKATKDTSGQQGVKRYDRTVRKSYHTEQVELFDLLLRSAKFPEGVKYSADGYLKRGDTKMRSNDFCNTLDEVTRTYIAQANDEVTTVSDELKSIRAHLRGVFDKCKEILWERQCGSSAAANDIVSEDGYKQWKSHVCVIVSYGALIVVLDVLSKKFGQSSFLSELKK